MRLLFLVIISFSGATREIQTNGIITSDQELCLRTQNLNKCVSGNSSSSVLIGIQLQMEHCWSGGKLKVILKSKTVLS